MTKSARGIDTTSGISRQLAAAILCLIALSCGEATAQLSVDLELSVEGPSPLADDANLHAVQFVGRTVGWAVGDRGVIWHTADGGRSWRAVPSPVDCPLRDVQFLTDRVGWIAGGMTTPFTRVGRGVLLHTRNGGESWEQLAPGKLPRLHSVHFFSMTEGVVVGEATDDHPSGVLTTVDGGKTWQDAPGHGTGAWRASVFLRPDVGVVAGTGGQSLLFGGGRLIEPRMENPGLRAIHDLTIARDDSGWMVGDGGLVLKTTNSGIVWDTPPAPLPAAVRDLFDFHAVCATGGKVWVAGTPGSVIWHSPDGGQTWQKQYTHQRLPLSAITMTDDGIGWAVGALGVMLRTADAGRTWQSVRGGDRRLAMLAVSARSSDVPLPLIVRQSGELGYRGGALMPIRHDLGPDGHRHRDFDLRLAEAVVAAGGNDADVDWRLPMSLPNIDRDAKRLIAEWNQSTEGRLSEVVLNHLIRELRMWRPSVIVLQQPAKEDVATRLLNDAVLHAIDQAADATRAAAIDSVAGLEPWTVGRVYLKLAPGSTGHSHLDPHEYLHRRGGTVADLAAAPESLLFTRQARESTREAYRQIRDLRDGRLIELTSHEALAEVGFFAGLAIAPGSAARRELSPIDPTELEQHQQIARRQRNFQAYADRFLEDPRQAAQLIGQLREVTAGMSNRQAALQLAELAAEYRRTDQWELVEATLIEMVERYPGEPVSAEAMRWLLQLWSSAETAWVRTRSQGALVSQGQVDPLATTQRLEQAIRQAQIVPELRLEEPGTTGVDPLAVWQSATPLNIGAKDGWRTGQVRHWHQQAVKMAALIRRRHPQLFETPEISFPLAGLFRHREAYSTADRVYRNRMQAGQDGTWTKTAAAELWLTQPTPEPPAAMSVCRRAPAPPHLDGILSDECWKTADEIRLTAENPADPKAERHAFALFSYDARFLYVAASLPRHPEVSAEKVQIGERSHDAELIDFDRIHLSLDVDRDYTTWYSFAIDQRGWTSDSCFGNTTWNPKWYVAARGDDEHWRIEVAIPFEELGPSPPQRNHVWAIGLTRILPAVGIESWTHPAGTQPRPDSFGLLKFD